MKEERQALSERELFLVSPWTRGMQDAECCSSLEAWKKGVAFDQVTRLTANAVSRLLLASRYSLSTLSIYFRLFLFAFVFFLFTSTWLFCRIRFHIRLRCFEISPFAFTKTNSPSERFAITYLLAGR